MTVHNVWEQNMITLILWFVAICESLFCRQAIDVNNDDNISKEELRSLYLDYMMNEQPHPLSVIYLSSRKHTHRRP